MEEEIEYINIPNIEDEQLEEDIIPTPPNIVYIRVDSNNNIIEINSDEFISDTSNWIKIDEGYGDKYRLAQNNYLKKNLFNDDQTFNYKYINNEIVEV